MEKLNYYITRTFEHIHRVQKNAVCLATKYAAELELDSDEIREFMHNVAEHDSSKFSETQFLPYIELTEYYRQRKNLGNKDYQYPEGVEVLVNVAVNDHYERENHHPEGIRCWGKLESLECACDLQAMAQEFGEGSARKYFENVWMKKHETCFIPSAWIKTTGVMLKAIECFEKESTLCLFSRRPNP